MNNDLNIKGRVTDLVRCLLIKGCSLSLPVVIYSPMNLKTKGDNRVCRVGLDMDDVLMNFVGAFCDWHNKQFGTSLIREDVTSFQLEVLSHDRQEIIECIRRFYGSPEHKAALPHSKAVEVVQKLQTSMEVFVVTSRPETAAPETYSWLKKHFPGLVNRVYFTRESLYTEQKISKSEVCRQLALDIFVDDAPQYIEDVSRTVPKPLLFDSPWNRDFTPNACNIQRVYGWDEVLHHINLLNDKTE